MLFACFATVTLGVLSPFTDHSFSCPYKDACVPLCVADTLTDCPDTMQCDLSLSLCDDGTCQSDCTGHDDNPCEDICGFPCAPETIHNPNHCESTYPEEYGTMYAGLCDSEGDGPWISYYLPGFVFCYVWLALVGGLSLIWMFLNQRVFPVGMVEPFLPNEQTQDNGVSKLELDNPKTHVLISSTQTGYKTNYIALFLYVLVIVTCIGFQLGLLILNLMYYDLLEDQIDFDKDTKVFFNESQILQVYEVTWHVGLAWCLFLKWPSSIINLFRRRCHLKDAEYVIIFRERNVSLVVNDRSLAWMRNFIDAIRWAFDSFFVYFFSDVTHPRVPGTTTTCPIVLQADGSRSFYFQMRKFNYNASNQRFEPASIVVGKQLNELVASNRGLTSAEVDVRTMLVGRNVVNLPPPSPIAVLFAEFKKPFYLYQNFMSWTWFSFSYW
jgi:hypothetical protein